MSFRITQAEYRALTGQKGKGRGSKRLAQRRGAAKATGGKIRHLEVFLPITIVSEANLMAYEHWAVTRDRKIKQQQAFNAEWMVLAGRVQIEAPCTIKLTRIGAQKMDSGNLEVSFKWVQDAIAAAIGIDDGDSRLTWLYEQQIDPTETGIIIEFTCEG